MPRCDWLRSGAALAAALLCGPPGCSQTPPAPASAAAPTAAPRGDLRLDEPLLAQLLLVERARRPGEPGAAGQPGRTGPLSDPERVARAVGVDPSLYQAARRRMEILVAFEIARADRAAAIRFRRVHLRAIEQELARESDAGRRASLAAIAGQVREGLERDLARETAESRELGPEVALLRRHAAELNLRFLPEEPAPDETLAERPAGEPAAEESAASEGTTAASP